ncbi:MAG TPA: MFS transporter [Candidatus Dormibacteraeota bacterium]|nr:MFS transporter [Candidatus Dormibacteraeota bacterium]
MVTIAPPVVSAPGASIGQRLDRLPLTWTLWRLGLVAQAGWALVIASDGIAARIYPFVWGPAHAFDTASFSLLLVVSTGLGIVVGEYVFAALADRFGRRSILLVAAAVCGLGTLPAAFTDNFYLLLLLLGLGATGIGGVIATNIVYMAEVAPSAARGKMTQSSQAFAIFLLNGVATVFAIALMPQHYQAYIAVIAAGPLLVYVPLVAWVLPESPRWLDAHGRHDQAEKIVARLERDSAARAGALPPPVIAEVAAQSRVDWRDLFGPRYLRRTVLLLICWTLGYSGLVYGPIGFMALYLAREGFSARAIFTAALVGSAIGAPGIMLASGRLNERFERRYLILAGAAMASIGLLLVIVATVAWHSLIALSVAQILVSSGFYLWLFNMYTYTAVAYPTRIRSVATGWTDGFGHIGSMLSPLIVGTLFTATAGVGYLGFYAYVIIPGALVPALLLARFGVNQRAAPLEALTGV